MMSESSKINPSPAAQSETAGAIRTQEFYEFLADGLKDLEILMLSPKGEILSWNKGAEIIHQFTASEAIGKNFSACYLPSDQERNIPANDLEQAARTGRFEGCGWRLKKDGTQVWVDIIISRLVGKDGATQGFVKVARDATERRKAEDQLNRQKRDMIELSTPVLHLWPGVLALPIVGALDSARSQIMTERLLQGIVTSGSSVAILDITGVPAVDTIVAQHLIKTVAAARLMGAECIISGIRPEIAQTMVHLGVDLSKVRTKSTMARALEEALNTLNLAVVQSGHQATKVERR